MQKSLLLNSLMGSYAGLAGIMLSTFWRSHNRFTRLALVDSLHREVKPSQPPGKLVERPEMSPKPSVALVLSILYKGMQMHAFVES